MRYLTKLFFYLIFLTVTVNFLFVEKNFDLKKCSVEIQDFDESSDLEEETEADEVETPELISNSKPLFLFKTTFIKSFIYKESTTINRSNKLYTPPQQLS